ncbi:unnamed protein product [Rangifer tarandus platyrhynchus]|uniref:Uncharacterized protein n=2 Tax=Rangifer tarandus platyrhynchus TaxID=3082113 RepID=A0AC59ZP40_RANTA|nr:unnamed protein product [Rangifer tarandus platyrhynchus]
MLDAEAGEEAGAREFADPPSLEASLLGAGRAGAQVAARPARPRKNRFPLPPPAGPRPVRRPCLRGACPLRQGTAEGLLRTNAVRACAAPRPWRLRAPSPAPRAAAAPESRSGGARRGPEEAQHLQLSECARVPRGPARGGGRGGRERAGAAPAPLSPEGPALARRRGAH